VSEIASRENPWRSLAGPAVFGRSLLVASGTAVPPPWAGCEYLHLSEVSILDPAVLKVVRHNFLTRTPVIYEIDSSLAKPEPSTEMREVWSVPPDLDFVAEAVWRIVTANSVDGRNAGNPVWPPAERAVRAGATRNSGRAGDVVMPNGAASWCDGGPLQLWAFDDEGLGGVAVILASAIAARQFSPVAAHPPTASLAPDQFLAVTDPSPRARIIAPAGSGKTRVLTERARHVLNSGISADSVLLVAYNTRARGEMRERTSDLPGLHVETLNALGLAIINGTKRFSGQGQKLTHIDEPEVRNIISTLVKLPKKANTDSTEAWIEALSTVRLGLQSPQQVEADYGGDIEGFAEFFPQYRQYLAERNLEDYDEQIYRALELLLRNPKLRFDAERFASVLLVDEFQDLNPAHMLLLRLLAGPQLSIFAVGDDDQTIYGFSGATPEWLVSFEDHVPDAVHHALEVNYRCPAPVITAATNLMSHNSVRVPKKVRPGPKNVTTPESYEVIKSNDQIVSVIERIKRLIGDGAKPAEIVVLTRVNSLLPPVQVFLVEAGIPFSLRGGENFLTETGVGSALAWLRLAVDPEHLRSTDIFAATGRPGRGLSRKVREWMGEQDSIVGLDHLAGRLKDADAQKVASFARDVESIAKFAEGQTTSSLIKYIRTEIGLDRAMATLDASHQGRNTASKSDGLRSLIALGAYHIDPKTFESWLRRSLATAQDGSGVVLSTVHRVKGLEWPHVIIFDASSGIFPHRLSIDLDEERRVFHVAITRCQQSLMITAEADEPSMFLSELSSVAPPAQRSRPRADQLRRRNTNTVERPQSTGSQKGSEPISVAIGLRFKWSGYECVIRSVNIDGVLVSTGEHEITVPFGAEVLVKGRSRKIRHHRATWVQGETGSPTPSNLKIAAALKAWRLEQSRADDIPAFHIFSNRTLDELSRTCPRTVAELLDIGGIGPAKADRFGDQILAVIKESLTG
jgi:DNA helicase-2/ATP-dependent DNA helicase PcrA